MSTPPPLPLAIQLGAANRASRSLLDQVLDRVELSFEQWVVLRGLATSESGGSPSPTTEELTRLMGEGADHLLGPIASLLARGLVEGDPLAPQLTDVGREQAHALVAEVAAISAYVLEGVDEADLASTSRVLQHMTRRVEARLAGA